MDYNPMDEALEAYLAEDETTSIMSTQLLREKLTESMVPSEIPPPPETQPACPDAFRKRRGAACQRRAPEVVVRRVPPAGPATAREPLNDEGDPLGSPSAVSLVGKGGLTPPDLRSLGPALCPELLPRGARGGTRTTRPTA